MEEHIMDFEFELMNEQNQMYFKINKHKDIKRVVYIPSSIAGIPVKEIGHHAFCSPHTQVIIIPQSIQRIEEHAFGPDETKMIYTEHHKTSFPECELHDLLIRYDLLEIKKINQVLYATFKDGHAYIFGYDSCETDEMFARFGKSLMLEDCIDKFYLVEGIEEATFMDIDSLVKIGCPKTLKWIGKRAFKSCERLEEVVLPETLEEIHSEAFMNCSMLSRIELPRHLKHLGLDCFKETPRLMLLLESRLSNELVADLKDDIPLWGDFITYHINQNVLYALASNGQAAVMKGLMHDVGDLWIPETVLFEDNSYEVIAIAPFAFYQSRYIRKVHLPHTLKEIHQMAFGDSSLISIHLGSQIEYLGKGVFSNCLYLQDLVLPSTLTEIPASLLNNCQSLTHVDIPRGVEVIHKEAFMNCRLLSHIKFPSMLRKIGEAAFYGTSLSYIELGYAVCEVSDLAFAEIEELRTVVILNKDIYWGSHVISKYQDLYVFLEGDENTQIRESFHHDSEGKTKVYVGAYKVFQHQGIKYLVTDMDILWVVGYDQEEVLEEVHILSSVMNAEVEQIIPYALKGIKHLNKLVLPDTIIRIGQGFLEDAKDLESLVIPDHLNIRDDISVLHNKGINIQVISIEDAKDIDMVYLEVKAYVKKVKHYGYKDIKERFGLNTRLALEIMHRLNEEKRVNHHEKPTTII